jgi:hypothetical protein
MGTFFRSLFSDAVNAAESFRLQPLVFQQAV